MSTLTTFPFLPGAAIGVWACSRGPRGSVRRFAEAADVEEKAREDFDRVVAELCGEEPGHGRGCVEWTPGVEGARDVPASELEGGGKRDCLVVAETVERCEVLGCQVEEAPEASCLEDRVVGAPGGLRGREVGEEQAHELAVAEGAGAISQEGVDRAFGTGAVRIAHDVI